MFPTRTQGGENVWGFRAMKKKVLSRNMIMESTGSRCIPRDTGGIGRGGKGGQLGKGNSGSWGTQQDGVNQIADERRGLEEGGKFCGAIAKKCDRKTRRGEEELNLPWGASQAKIETHEDGNSKAIHKGTKTIGAARISKKTNNKKKKLNPERAGRTEGHLAQGKEGLKSTTQKRKKIGDSIQKEATSAKARNRTEKGWSGGRRPKWWCGKD